MKIETLPDLPSERTLAQVDAVLFELTSHQHIYISDLVVTRAMRGTGVGSSLMNAVIEQIHSRGLTRIQVGVLSANIATKHFYGICGFAEYSLVMKREIV